MAGFFQTVNTSFEEFFDPPFAAVARLGDCRVREPHILAGVSRIVKPSCEEFFDPPSSRPASG
ncbi:MAG: hypothetical protein QM761_15075, partial [Pseudoxanthomonas sp.]